MGRAAGTSSWAAHAVSPEEAVARIRSGMRVFIHGAAATPTPLIEALSRRSDLEGVSLYHLHTAGPAPFADPGQERRFTSGSLFTRGAPRGAGEDRTARLVALFLSGNPPP